MSEDKFPFFGHLISPELPSSFMDKYWLKNSLYIERKQDQYYKDVLSVSQIDELLQNENLSPVIFRILSAGTDEGVKYNYTKTKRYERSAEKVVDTNLLLDALKQGMTVEINSGSYVIESASNYQKGIGLELGMPTVSKVFITPPKSAALAAHFDLHQVFVLQISGTKHWQLYHSPDKISDQNAGVAAIDEKSDVPVFDKVIHPGDLLYVPGGMIHSAKATDQTSIHITIGIKPFQWYEMLEKLSATAMDIPLFRQKIPDVFSNEEDVNVFKTEFLKQTISLIEKTDFAKLIQRHEGGVRDEYVAGNSGQFTQMMEAEKLDEQTIIGRNRHMSFELIVKDGMVGIKLAQKTLNFPKMLKPVLQDFLQNADLSIKDHAPKYPLEMKLNLAKKLVSEGLLTVKA